MNAPAGYALVGALLVMASACADDPRQAPFPLGSFAVGDQLLVAEGSSNRVFAFNVLGSQGSLLPSTLPIEGRFVAARCLDARGELIGEGDCSVPGELLICTSHEGPSWRLWRFAPSTLAPPQFADLEVSCADIRYSDRANAIVVAPELSTTGIVRGPDTETDAPALAVIRWPGTGASAPIECPSMQQTSARVHYITPEAPEGARAEALVALLAAPPGRARRQDTPDLALSFGSYIGIAHGRLAPTTPTVCEEETPPASYEFIDLVETASGAGRISVAFTGDPGLIATRRGSRSVYVARLGGEGVRQLTRTLLAEPAQDALALGNSASDVLVLSGPGREGQGRLQIVETESAAGGIRARQSEPPIDLPGAADVLTAIPRADAGNTTLAIPWNSQGPNDHVSIVNAELVGIPGALAIRHYPVPTPFSSVTVLDRDHVVLSTNSAESTSDQLLSIGDGIVRELLEPGERRLAPPAVSGPYVRLVVATDQETRLVFVSFDGVRAPHIPLPEAPLAILSNTQPRGSAGAPLRMALLFDNNLGELSIVGGIPPEWRYDATGYLGTAVWQEGSP